MENRPKQPKLKNLFLDLHSDPVRFYQLGKKEKKEIKNKWKNLWFGAFFTFKRKLKLLVLSIW
jgi:hypothetical protein